MADLQKIVDELSDLTVLEAADLSKMLKEKWNGERLTMLFEERERTRHEHLRRGENL
jgi:ribosomal protein L7/L12